MSDDADLNDDADLRALVKLDSIPVLDEEAIAIISNTLLSIGPAKLQKGTKDHSESYAAKVNNALYVAAKFTGNEVWNVACCVRTEIIEKFDITEKNYILPAYPFKGVTFQYYFLLHLKECFDKYNEGQKALMEKNGARYLPTTDWTTLEELIKVGLRWHLQIWHLHQKKTRQESFEHAKKLLFERCAGKVRPPAAMKQLVKERMIEDYGQKLLALETQTHKLTNGEKITFTEESNANAQELFEELLDLYGFKWNRREHELDNITAFQEFLCSPNTDADIKTKFAKFASMHPLEDWEYSAAKLAMERRQQKKDEQAAKKAAIEEEKEKAKEKATQQQLTLQNAALSLLKKQNENPAPAPAPAPAPKTVPRWQRRVSVRSVPAAPKLTKDQRQENDLVESMAVFVTKILPGLKHIDNEDNVDSTCGSSNSERAEKVSDHDKPKKVVVAVDEKAKSATVEYVMPGQVFSSGLARRFTNIHHFVDALFEKNEALSGVVNRFWTLAEHGKKRAESTGQWMSIEGLTVAAAVFVDTSGNTTINNDKADPLQLPCLSPEGESAFANDLNAISRSFLSPLRKQTLPESLALFHLVFNSADPTIVQARDDILNDSSQFAPACSQQLKDLGMLVAMLSLLGKRDGPVFDPFETVIECVVPDILKRARAKRKRPLLGLASDFAK